MSSSPLPPASSLLLLLLLSVHLCGHVADAHARLMQPPSRASMWRKGYDTPADFNDNQGFCGGFIHQYNVNDGRCGICGDPFDANPRDGRGSKPGIRL